MSAADPLSYDDTKVFQQNAVSYDDPTPPPEVKIKVKVFKNKRGEVEHSIEDKSPDEKEEMREVARFVSVTVREELDALMEIMKNKLAECIENNTVGDYDRMSQDAQIFIMITMRKDGVNSQSLLEFADVNVVKLRDQISEEQKNTRKLVWACISAGVMIAGSLSTIGGVYKGSKDIVKYGQAILGIGQALHVGETFNEAMGGSRVTYLNVTKEITMQKGNENSSQSRRSDEAQRAASQIVAKMRESLHQLFFSINRNY